MDSPEQPTGQMDVLPVHGLLGLWRAQLTDNNSDFRMFANSMGAQNLMAGASVALLYLINRDGPDLFTGFNRMMTAAQQTIVLARSAHSDGLLPAQASVDAQNFAIEMLTGTTIEGDGISLSIKTVHGQDAVMCAMGVLIPINIAAARIVTDPKDTIDLIESLRAEFWAVENRMRGGSQ